MLGRANKKYQASAPPPPPPPPPPGKSALEKQLFPSSSPAAQDGDISRWVSGKRPSSFSSNASLVSPRAGDHEPLQPSSGNPTRPDFKKHASNSVTGYCGAVQPSKGFASLYAQSDSFKDDVSTSGTLLQPETTMTAPVYIADGDFSEDESLDFDLDYERPNSAPSEPGLPPVNKQAVEVRDGPRKNADPPTSQMSWSSSPQSHFQPPGLIRKPSLKRESSNDSPPVALRPAKKRTLPPNFRRNRIDNRDKDGDGHLSDQETTQVLSTPEAKPEKPLPWNSTFSAMKEQRKQLKIQSKKSEAGPEVLPDNVKSGKSAISLSWEQKHVIDLVIRDRQSVFFTGPAGTGKSVLMRAIIADLKKKWLRDPERLSITASTGLAACNIGGMTLHSFAGIGLGREDVPTLVKKIRRNAKAKNRWLRTSTLIIDEVSMVDAELFDKLSQIARTIRNNGRPWGNIQLVVTGDFFQLPPVPDAQKRDVKFAFDASTWNTSIDHTIGLTQVFRQRDSDFAAMLNEMRLGRISEATVQAFRGLTRPLILQDGLEATELFPTRQEVDRANDTRLRNLGGEVYTFEAADAGDPKIRDKLLQNMMAPKAIQLKKQAQVMLIKNMDDTLVNGSLGKVVGFMNEMTFEQWSAKEDVEVSGDGDEGDSRAKKKIKAFSRDADSKDFKEYPVVRFTATDGSHRTLLCVPEEWKVELPNGEVQAKRTQLPLILAWALSIHKAQGQTLERVRVDLGRVFEKGQAYVALSRATHKEGLQVLRFDPKKVMAHPRVINFYDKLYSAEAATLPKGTVSIAKFAKREMPAAAAAAAAAAAKDVHVHDDFDDEEEAMAAYG